MSQYKFYIFPITLIILLGFLGVAELLSQMTTANAAHGPGEIVITPNPSSIEANGISTSTITAVVSNITGTIPNTPVTFATTLGVINPSMDETDINGRITTTLISAMSSGTATISATATMSSNMQITSSTEVTFISGPPTTMTLTTKNEQIKVFDTNVITATLQDAYQNLVSSIPITFTSSLGKLSDSPVATNENGVATVTLSTDEMTGTAIVTGTIITDEGVISDIVNIKVERYQLYLPLISKPLIPTIVLAANPLEILYNQTSTITAEVKDNNDNALSGQKVFFESSVGTSITPTMKTTNDNGIVTATLTIASNMIGTASITGTVAGISSNIDIPISPYSTTLLLTEEDNWTYESHDGSPTTYQEPFILGNNNLSACENGLPNPGNWILMTKKPISPPQGATQATVHVDFILKTFDRNVELPQQPTEDYDFFKIEVQSQDDAPLITRYANQTQQSGCNESPHEFDLEFNESVSLTENTELKIILYVGNRLDGYYNTWVEISEVSIDWE